MMLEYILVILLLVYDSNSIFKSELLRNLEQTGAALSFIVYIYFVLCRVVRGMKQWLRVTLRFKTASCYDHEMTPMVLKHDWYGVMSLWVHWLFFLCRWTQHRN